MVNNGVRVEEKGDEKRDGDGCVEPVVLFSTYCMYNLKKDVW